MAILRAKQMREMSDEELDKKLADLRMELMKERAKAKVGGVPDNPGRMREIRLTIARILTIKKEREVLNKR